MCPDSGSLRLPRQGLADLPRGEEQGGDARTSAAPRPARPGPWFKVLTPGTQPPADAPFPLVAKPREGVASLDVQLCRSAAELADYCAGFWQRQPGRALLLDAYMEGPLFTLETLGDGQRLQAIGGFDVTLSPPPHFVELEARWNGPLSRANRSAALAQVAAFGVNFGVCHSEFILTANGPVLVEINYRSIGDGREFLLDRLLPQGWFARILALHLGEPLDDSESSSAAALVHYLSAFTALGAPLFLPRILADLGSAAPTWSIGVLYGAPRWRRRSGGA